ncbi:uncharacterized protein [Macrobrachium rosenbergii]|uniref:uncharacterized protein n=1 Tax=Macrobrachium rosenbergii TaxID=79674 RepID=UPI0034D71C0F
MTWLTQIATVLVLAMTLLTPGGAVDCFLCSYSPRGNSTRADRCTDENFVKEETEVGSCSLGCESVLITDVNGEMESFHRNCATKSTMITNSCETQKTILLTKRVCSCDWPYCNSASRHGLSPSKLVAIVTTAMAVSWWSTLRIPRI